MGNFGRLHGLALPPDCDDDDGVAAGDDDRGDEEQGGADQGHVELPVPLLRELDPALDAVLRVVFRDGQVVEEDDGDGEGDGQGPGRGHQPLGSPP